MKDCKFAPEFCIDAFYACVINTEVMWVCWPYQFDLSGGIQPCESLCWWLQPVLFVITRALALDAVKGIDDPALLAEVLLAFVQQISMNKN